MLEPQNQGWNVVLVGAWNPAILSPPWLSEHVFLPVTPGKRDIAGEVYIPLAGSGVQLIRFPSEELEMQIDPTRLLLRPITPTFDGMKKVWEMGRQLLKTLSHTPITALGLNFSYKLVEPPDAVRNLFDTLADDPLLDLGMPGVSAQIKRTLKMEDEESSPVLNFEIEQDLEAHEYTFDFNYHHKCRSALQAADILGKATTKIYDHMGQVLEVYGLTSEN